jgi:hypothetical protein
MQLGRLGDRAALARTLAFGDLDGDGRSDAATVLSCNAGGVPWGELIAFYTRDRTTGGIRLLGSVELSKVTVPAGADGMGRAYVSAVRYRDGGVDVTWTSNQNDDCGGCLTLDYRGTLRWDGRRIMPSRLTGTTEVPTARTFVAALRSGDLAAAGRVAQPAAVQAGAGLLAAYPAARQAPLNCSSYNGLLFAPKPLADETLAGTLPQGDRYCTIQADAESYLVVVMRHQGFESWRVASVLVVSSQVGGD